MDTSNQLKELWVQGYFKPAQGAVGTGILQTSSTSCGYRDTSNQLKELWVQGYFKPAQGAVGTGIL